ncbi:MAG TPA: hypothetical protein PKN26_07710, partial [Giesbergeria sp.]|nr:hypothetical protein [Giesbergeria sp.]
MAPIPMLSNRASQIRRWEKKERISFAKCTVSIVDVRNRFDYRKTGTADASALHHPCTPHLDAQL